MFLEDIFRGGTEGIFSGIKGIIQSFKGDPLELAKLEFEIHKAEAQLQATLVAAVNATMQAEAKSEHWAQWAWRPTFGFTGAAILVNNYLLLPYFAPLGIVPIAVPSEVWLMLLAVLGVAAWTRGQAQIESVKRNGV